MGKSLAYFLSTEALWREEQAAGKGARRAGLGLLRRNAAVHEMVDRLAFEFNMATDRLDSGASELPTTLSRARIDLGVAGAGLAGSLGLGAGLTDDDELIMAHVDSALVARAAEALLTHRSGRHKKPPLAAAAAATAAAAAAAVAASAEKGGAAAASQKRSRWDQGGKNDNGDDDIFAEAGAYNPNTDEIPLAGAKRSRWDEAAAPALPPAPDGSYFDDLRALSSSTAAVAAAVAAAAAPRERPTEDDEDELESTATMPSAKGASGGEGKLAGIMSGIKGLAQAVDRMEARKSGAGTKAAADGGLGMGGAGEGYGEDHDYDFAGEDA